MNDIEKEIIDNYRLESQRCIDHLVKTNFRYFIFSMASIVSMLIMTAMFLFYLYQYDFSVETTTTMESVTVEQDTTDGGNANYISGDGDITNGETDNRKENSN